MKPGRRLRRVSPRAIGRKVSRFETPFMVNDSVAAAIHEKLSLDIRWDGVGRIKNLMMGDILYRIRFYQPRKPGRRKHLFHKVEGKMDMATGKNFKRDFDIFRIYERFLPAGQASLAMNLFGRYINNLMSVDSDGRKR